MISGVVAFVAGVVLFMHMPGIPDPAWKLIMPVAIAAALRFSFLRLPTLLLCGFFWALLSVNDNLSTWLDDSLQGEDLQLEGVISSLPSDNGTRVRFEFTPSRMFQGEQELEPLRRVMLSWYRTDATVRSGESWRFMVRLKRPHGFYNPGSFDYASWLFRNGIGATGYIKPSELNVRLSTSASLLSINRIRESLAQQLEGSLGEGIGTGILTALVVGIRSGIESDAWHIFSRTGTNHLVAISGLHIGIVATVSFFLGRLLWRLSGPFAQRFPASHAGAIAALIFALLYAALAGFSTPTLRALLMVGVVLLTLVWRRTADPFRGLASALFIIVLLDPYAVMSAGFWLSFAAVGIIILVMSWRNGTLKGPWPWVRIQVLIAMGLAPVLAVWGFQVSIIAPLVNLVAVPLFTLFLVPLALSGVVLLQVWEWAGFGLLALLVEILEKGYLFLGQIAEYPFVAVGLSQVSWIGFLFMLTGALLLLLPAGVPGKGVGGLFLVSILFWPQSRPGMGEFSVTILDVGQGLAVVVETANRVLLYDTGPRYSSGFDAGEAVVIPYLKSRGIQELDTLVLSNGDMDHQGGFRSVKTIYPIGRVLSGEPLLINHFPVELCSSDITWSWDGVEFEVLHPGTDRFWRGNNASCVIQVHSPEGSVMLTGDVESAAESALVNRTAEPDGLDILVVPHHGSSTSSSAEFVTWSSPRYAVVSAGYRNRYGFPRPEVRARYKALGAKLISTFDSGAVTFKFTRSADLPHPIEMREAEKRLWIR